MQDHWPAMPAVKKELPGREDLALALATFHPTLAALPLPPLPGYLAPLPAVAALPPAASLPAATAGYEALLAPPLRASRAYLSLHEASPHLHLPRDPLALERFSATAAAAPDFQPLLDNGEPCIEVECGANRALLYVRKLCQGSKGPSIRHRGEWLTPNEFQFVSGRETAKDWKRSIRHKGAPAVGARAASVPLLRSPRTRGSGPHSFAIWETPSPPREGAVTLGLQQEHPPPSPPPNAVRSPRWTHAERPQPPRFAQPPPRGPRAACGALATRSFCSEGLCGIPGPRGAGEVYGNSGEQGGGGLGRTLPSPRHPDAEPRALAGGERHTCAQGAGARCWRAGRGVGVAQAGGGRGAARQGGGARRAAAAAAVLGAACWAPAGV